MKKNKDWWRWKNALLGNLKLEVIVIVGLIIFIILDKVLFDCSSLFTILKGYFTADRFDNIQTMLGISIGIYVAILSILSTSTTSASDIIVKHNLDYGLIIMTSLGLLENLSVIVFTTLIVPFGGYYYLLISILLVLALKSFGVFLVFIILMFLYNMQVAAPRMDEEKKFKEYILILLEDIKSNTNK